jgi:ABC-type glycerol-3-phosphate transport system permease component
MLRKLYYIALLLLIVCLDLTSYAQGCSQCRARIETSRGEDLSVGNGINMAILFLMLIPYVILFFLFRKKIFGFFKEFSALWR